MKITTTIILTLLWILLPPVVFGATPDVFKEYVTYGNFYQTANSFERIALIVSDNSFQNFLIVAFLSALLVWAGMVVGRFLFGGGIGNSVIQGLVIILTGTLIYLAFIKPVGDMAVYDESSGRHKIISNIPDGIVILAGIQNTVVRSIVNMIWTSSDTLSFRQNAGGDIFNIFGSVFNNSLFIPSKEDSSGGNLNQSIKSYWRDCSKNAIGLSGGASVDDFSNGTISETFDKLISGNVFTTYYGSGSGVTVTCTAAHDSIISELNGFAADKTGKKFWEEKCGDAGYYEMLGVTGPGASEVCRQKVVDFLIMKNTSVTDLGLIREIVISNALFSYLKSYDSQSVSDFKMMAGMSGEASTSTAWLPIIKGTVFAVYIGLIPFLLILIPTLLFPRVLQFIFGIFVFMVAWEICDSILHSYAMDLSMAIIEDVFKEKLSLANVWLMQGESFKALMLFGKMRWASMTLASVLSMVIAHYGGVAMAHFAGHMSFGPAGSQGSRETLDPTGRAREINSLPQVIPTEAVSNEYGFAGMQNSAYYGQRSAIESNLGIIREGSGVMNASTRQGQINVDGFTQADARLAAREHIEKETGISRAEQSRFIHTADATKAVGEGIAKNSIGIGPQFSLAAQGGYPVSAVKARMVDDINRYGKITPDTEKMKDDMLKTASGRGQVSEALTAWNTSGNPTHTTLNDEQKENLVSWYNKETGQNLKTSDVSSTSAITIGMRPDGSIAPMFVSGQEGHTSTHYANSNEIVGNDYKVESLRTELGNGTFAYNKEHKVLENIDNYAAAFSGAVSTYVSENQVSSVNMNSNTGAGVGTGGGSPVSANLGVSGSLSRQNALSENQIAVEIREKLSHARTDLEARQIMQSEYNSYRNYTNNSFDLPSTKNIDDSLDNAKKSLNNLIDRTRESF
ncbi:conjugal transfer protein TraG [Candidatus Roizmanbacteria bacterium]|nr:conjugal transfer protein TraG [Candidatus Roizmanbacteria bacterium]